VNLEKSEEGAHARGLVHFEERFMMLENTSKKIH